MKECINEFTELYNYREMSDRCGELTRVRISLEGDKHHDWCDQELNDLRLQLCLAVERYESAVDSRINKMTDDFYNKLDYADGHKNNKSFWKRIFGRGES